jgi:hypothetical protein
LGLNLALPCASSGKARPTVDASELSLALLTLLNRHELLLTEDRKLRKP